MCRSEVTSLSRAWLFAIPWTVAYKAPLSMEFSRQEYWSGLPFPSPGDLPGPGIEPRSPAFRADALPSGHQGSPNMCRYLSKFLFGNKIYWLVLCELGLLWIHLKVFFPSCYGICYNWSNSPYYHQPGDVFLKKKKRHIWKNICKLGLLRDIHLPPSWLWIISLTPLSLSFHLKNRESNTKTHLLYWMVMKLNYNNRHKQV